MPLHPFQGRLPTIDPTAFVAPGAQLIGDVELGPGASVWYNCVLRGDLHRIRLGARSNLQDGSVVHVDSGRASGDDGFPTLIGSDVLVGHLCIIHGCTVGDGAFVGMGSIVMDGCAIEAGAMLAAGSMLTPGKRVPTGELWGGRPARFMRKLTDVERAMMTLGPQGYAQLAKLHAASLDGGR
jgi:carbonic anhydrase/acetyltransferase-like protein (isoleucine patch superfamily)